MGLPEVANGVLALYVVFTIQVSLLVSRVVDADDGVRDSLIMVYGGFHDAG